MIQSPRGALPGDIVAREGFHVSPGDTVTKGRGNGSDGLSACT